MKGFDIIVMIFLLFESHSWDQLGTLCVNCRPPLPTHSVNIYIIHLYTDTYYVYMQILFINVHILSTHTLRVCTGKIDNKKRQTFFYLQF